MEGTGIPDVWPLVCPHATVFSALGGHLHARGTSSSAWPRGDEFDTWLLFCEGSAEVKGSPVSAQMCCPR